MSFKIIPDILTGPFEGDFTGDMDPFLKKVFGRIEKKINSVQSNASEIEE